MSCQETRQKLSMYADEALPEVELVQVKSHLAVCQSCRLALEEQGVLDMLLKRYFSSEPATEYFDAFWPSVAEKLDGAPPAEERPPNGGGARIPSDEEGDGLVFKSSPAMQLLNIPERSHPIIAPSAGEMPPPQSGSWRWPFAFVLSTAIAVAGFVYYKKMTAPPPNPALAQATMSSADEPAEVQEAVVTPPDASMHVASATPLEAGTINEPNSRESPAASAVSTKHGRAKSRRDRTAGAKGSKHAVEAKSAGAVAASTKKEGAVKVASAEGSASSGKKGDELDNLIDNAIGSKDAPKPAAKAAPVLPTAPDLPAQLNINQIQEGMRKVKGLVQSCYDQFQMEGLALVTVVIGNDGTVKEAKIKGKFFGTDTGTCVVTAVKKAKFSKFSGKEMKIPSYPFRLQ